MEIAVAELRIGEVMPPQSKIAGAKRQAMKI